MHFAIVSIVVQILLIVHVLRTGRPFFWIFVLIFLPGIGALIYVAVEILPELLGGLRARRALRRLRHPVLYRLQRQASRYDTRLRALASRTIGRTTRPRGRE